jgi:hypothetical protein
MKNIMSIGLLLSVISLGFTGCSYASASSDTRTYDVTGFTGVKVNSAFKVYVTRGEAYSVVVTAPRLEDVRVEKDGTTLRVSREGNLWFTPFQPAPKVEITMPQLTSLELSGASTGTVKGFESNSPLAITISGASKLTVEETSAGDLTLKVSGASRLDGEIKCYGRADFEVNGASTVNLDGFVQNVKANASGASRLNLGNYYAKDVDIIISGASNGTVNLTGRLDADISGASNLGWRGSPTMGNIETSGASNLHRD